MKRYVQIVCFCAIFCNTFEAISSSPYTEELIRLERRVRALEQPIWKVSDAINRWSMCTRGPCSCRPEIRTLSCWNIQLDIVPFNQVLPRELFRIDLGGNLLRTLNKETFQVLSQLEELDLINNKLDYLPENIFDKLMNLGRLQQNLLDELSSSIFESLKNLKTLDISANKLKDLPEDLFVFNKFLKVVRLANNKIEEIPENLFAHSRILEDIDLSANEIHHIGSSLKKLPLLKKLKLDENKLKHLSADSFAGLKVLTHLSLRKNYLANITSVSFFKLPDLSVMDLSSNNIVNLPPINFGQLNELHMQHNLIEDLSENLFINSSIQKLYIFSNRIKEIRKRAFAGLSSLSSLFVNNNILATTHASIFVYTPSLRKLRLDSNRFHFLPPKLLNPLKHLDSITLARNPWHCDCNMLYLSAWVESNSDTLWDPQPTCKGPGRLGGSFLKDMHFDSLCMGQWASMVNLAARVPVRQPSFASRP